MYGWHVVNAVEQRLGPPRVLLRVPDAAWEQQRISLVKIANLGGVRGRGDQPVTRAARWDSELSR